MQRTVYDLQVDASNIERQIAEKQLEINTLQMKLSELNVEYKRAVESSAMQQRDAAHAEIQAKQAEATAPVAEEVPAATA